MKNIMYDPSSGEVKYQDMLYYNRSSEVMNIYSVPKIYPPIASVKFLYQDSPATFYTDKDCTQVYQPDPGTTTSDNDIIQVTGGRNSGTVQFEGDTLKDGVFTSPNYKGGDIDYDTIDWDHNPRYPMFHLSISRSVEQSNGRFLNGWFFDTNLLSKPLNNLDKPFIIDQFTDTHNSYYRVSSLYLNNKIICGCENAIYNQVNFRFEVHLKVNEDLSFSDLEIIILDVE